MIQARRTRLTNRRLAAGGECQVEIPTLIPYRGADMSVFPPWGGSWIIGQACRELPSLICSPAGPLETSPGPGKAIFRALPLPAGDLIRGA